MDKDELQKKLLETFKIEADEHLRSIAVGLLQLEKNPSVGEYGKLTELLHRETHSLKGAARAVNLLDIELICHTLEKIFAAWKGNQLKPTVVQFDILHQTFNSLQQALQAEDKQAIVISKQLAAEIVARLNDLLQAKTPAAIEKNSLHTDNYSSTALSSNHVANLQTVRIASRKLDSLLFKAEQMLTVKLVRNKYLAEFTKLNDVIRTWKTEWVKLRHGFSSETIPVMLEEGLEQIKSLEKTLTTLHAQFEVDSRQFNTLVDGLLDDAKDMVMMPFSVLLNSFPTMVRNLSREQGKDINLIVGGAEIEIDKRILDELKDPLMHLIRNSIDHGIEPPAARQGKPAQGTIKIKVAQFNGNEIEISVADDGCGIDLKAVKESAVKQGFLSPEAAQTIADQEALALIYQSGITTSPVITNVSGHGLGMAIVSEKIDQLGGNIELVSKNTGTEFKLTLPLSLTTFKGILIKIADHTFVLPTANLDRVIRLRAEDISTVENKETILLDSQTLAFIRLQEVLGIKNPPEAQKKPPYFPVVIIHLGGNRAAFQVDEIHSEREVIVKKLNNPLLRVKYIAAATILETGFPVPILNTSDLIKSMLKDSLPHTDKTMPTNVNSATEDIILVVEDSITTRMLLKNILEMIGYVVITAVDGADAWRALKENKISLVVSDVEMPRMDGFELTKKIRNDKQFANLPVILVTTRESQQDREYGIDAGANAYIIKSNFDDGNLVAAIKRLL